MIERESCKGEGWKNSVKEREGCAVGGGKKRKF